MADVRERETGMSSRRCLSADLPLLVSSRSIIPPFEVPLSAVIDHVRMQGEMQSRLPLRPSEPLYLTRLPGQRCCHEAICSGTLLAFNRQWSRAAGPSAVFVEADYVEVNFIR